MARLVSTSRSVFSAQHMMLGVLLVVIPLGCAATPSAEPPAAATSEKISSTALSRDIAAEHPDLDWQPPPQTQPAPAPIDPGASHMVETLAAVIGEERTTLAGRVTVIGVTGIRNHSRCGADEFNAMLDRLASQLTHAGRSRQLAFTSDRFAEVDYHLLGTAYLITAEGFDLWEMFLTLGPADGSITLWSAPGPVNMLRQQRPSQPQILLGLNW